MIKFYYLLTYLLKQPDACAVFAVNSHASTQTCERVLRDTGVYVYRGEEADCTSEHVFVMTQQEKQLQLNAAAINAARITFICYSEHTHTLRRRMVYRRSTDMQFTTLVCRI